MAEEIKTETLEVTGQMVDAEKQGLHSTAFTIIYHAEKLEDTELVDVARKYLLRILSQDE